MWYVYELSDPRTHISKYVGATNDLDRRLRSHLALQCRTTAKWISELQSTGTAPLISPVFKGAKPAALKFESLHRSHLRTLGLEIRSAPPPEVRCPWCDILVENPVSRNPYRNICAPCMEARGIEDSLALSVQKLYRDWYYDQGRKHQQGAIFELPVETFLGDFRVTVSFEPSAMSLGN